MRIAIVTDAWRPQVNGVVRTYENTLIELKKLGHEVLIINHEGHQTIPCPSYPSIRLAILPKRRLVAQLTEFNPDAIHIATEGPLGHAARSWCLQKQLTFTTSFHTQFPEYVRMRAPIPVDWSYAYVRRFHKPAQRILVPTASQRERLLERNFQNVVIWSRGVNMAVFKPRNKAFLDLPRPVFMYMGRVAVEKNIETFLKLELPGSKVVVGDGPDLEKSQEKYRDVHFTGFKFGEELAQYLAAADVFVFPSLTDTFGIVLLEAMACGVPVAAYPVTGPKDVVLNGVTGILDEDLQKAAVAALELDPRDCIEFTRSHSWRKCSETFVNHLAPIGADEISSIKENAVNKSC